jgi:hypothetical protein
MTKEELAALLNGREYGAEITNQEASQAQASGLVVVFGGSDDLMEFQGAISDEVGCYDGGAVLMYDGGIFNNTECDSKCKYFQAAIKKVWVEGKEIKALWCKEKPYSWTYETDIPHATFDILEDGEKYCRGIVFDLKDAVTK